MATNYGAEMAKRREAAGLPALPSQGGSATTPVGTYAPSATPFSQLSAAQKSQRAQQASAANAALERGSTTSQLGATGISPYTPQTKPTSWGDYQSGVQYNNTQEARRQASIAGLAPGTLSYNEFVRQYTSGQPTTPTSLRSAQEAARARTTAPTVFPFAATAQTAPQIRDTLTGVTIPGAPEDTGSLIGKRPDQVDMSLSEKFDRDFFEPLSAYTEQGANQRVAQLTDFTRAQQALIDLASQARDRELDTRREGAQARKTAAQSSTAAEQAALLQEVDRKRRSAFNQMRGELARLGAIDTTGAGQVSLARLGEVYDAKAIDVKLAANKQLQEIENTYWQVRESIESDQTKSDIEKMQALTQLNQNVTNMWQQIQADKQSSILALGKAAYDIGAESYQQERDQKIRALEAGISAGQDMTALMQELGMSPEVQNVYRDVANTAREQNKLDQLTTRIGWLDQAVQADFSINQDIIRQLSGILNVPEAELMAEAQRIAAAEKLAYQRKASGRGTGAVAQKWDYNPIYKVVDGVRGYEGYKGGVYTFEPLPEWQQTQTVVDDSGASAAEQSVIDLQNELDALQQQKAALESGVIQPLSSSIEGTGGGSTLTSMPVVTRDAIDQQIRQKELELMTALENLQSASTETEYTPEISFPLKRDYSSGNMTPFEAWLAGQPDTQEDQQ